MRRDTLIVAKLVIISELSKHLHIKKGYHLLAITILRY